VCAAERAPCGTSLVLENKTHIRRDLFIIFYWGKRDEIKSRAYFSICSESQHKLTGTERREIREAARAIIDGVEDGFDRVTSLWVMLFDINESARGYMQRREIDEMSDTRAHARPTDRPAGR
jgi:hypothetical protein